MSKTTIQKNAENDETKEKNNISTSEKSQETSTADIMNMLSAMKEEIASLKSEKQVLETQLLQNALEKQSMSIKSEDISVIWNSPGRLEIDLPNLNLTMVKMGEERQVTLEEFQTLVGKYRRFFEKELLVLSPKNIGLAAKYQVSVYDEASKRFIHPEDLNKIGDMSVSALEDYYSNLSDNSKSGLLTYWLGKCYEAVPDSRFYNIGKLDSLNRISHSKTFDFIIKEIQKKEESTKTTAQ